ncbi:MULTISPECIES: S41 family peptidase [unclassified Sphingomonas]|uniref:S41 family peptidase n=1 Tax=unclassified Sphingomonas TaxID=196159 RepID=UPI002150BC9F|nr:MULTISPECIES: S41 family peptidase [unclassified Sphingomonas]MCR5869624.1 S41 family peptidase [Sphingomonas sp. J344]UUX98660.1 S41 family peptidase [Sphingomonas sp. J315]
MRKEVIAAITLAAMAPLAMAQSEAPAPAPAAAYDAAAAKAAIATLADELEKNFVFPDTAKRYAAALRTKLAAGGYDGLTDGYTLAGVVTADLQAIAPDGHLAMFAPGGPQSQRVGQPSTQQQIGNAPLPPPAMEQAGMIAPGIAYARFNGFFGEPDVLKAFTAFLDRHAGAKTLIIDARTHRGGGLDEMDVLFPRIFDKAQAVMVMDTRASFAEQGGPLPFRSLVKVDAPAELARVEHRVTPASPASPWAKTKIYYLTSPRTASAAEHLASVFKGTKRATLIGATTAGAGHYGGTAPLGGGYSAFIPVGRSYFPGGDGWEQVGITPDIAVAPERALHEALVREGVPAAQAETLSASHMPKGPMERRKSGKR